MREPFVLVARALVRAASPLVAPPGASTTTAPRLRVCVKTSASTAPYSRGSVSSVVESTCVWSRDLRERSAPKISQTRGAIPC
jgi:hypothetical protein